MLGKQVVGSGKDVLIAQNFNFTDCALNSDLDQTLGTFNFNFNF